MIKDLEGLFACVYELVPLQLGALHKRLATLGTDVHAWTVSVKVLAHCSIVSKQLAAALHHQ